LEKEYARSAEEPKIFDPIPDPFLGTRLTTDTIKKINDATFEVYKNTGTKIDSDIPITLQVTRDLAEGKIALPDLEAALKKNGATLDQLGNALAGTESNAGRALNLMSQLKRRMQLAGLEIPGFEKEPPSWGDYGGDLFRRWTNIWRGALTSALSTAVRNIETQTVRVGLEGVEKMVDGTLQRMFRLGPKHEEAPSRGFGQALESWTDLLKSGKRQQAMEILNVFPSQKDRMFSLYASDVALAQGRQPIPAKLSGVASKLEAVTRTAEQSIEYANFLNKGQEFLIRKAAFRAKLADILDKKGFDIDTFDPRAIDVKDIAASVDHALEMTFAVTPTKGIGKMMMDLYKVAPPLYYVMPFPRFMWNSWKFFSDFSPLGFTKLLSPTERGKIAAGDTKVLSRAIMGTGLLGAAYLIRNSDAARDGTRSASAANSRHRPYNLSAPTLCRGRCEAME
jgi:hypothetical protein